jgi:hypothetical protein
MAFCPNLSNPKIKEEFDTLVSKYGEKSANYIWHRQEEIKEYSKNPEKINSTAAKQWLNERGLDVTFYDYAKNIGDKFVHGYVQNASMYLWTAADSGTEYHEGYHMVFRTMLSQEQRDQLYSEAAKMFGEPTAEEIATLKELFPINDSEARLLALEEKMADEFMEYVKTEGESGTGLLAKLGKWFKDLMNWIKSLISDDLSIKQLYSLVESNKMSSSFASRGVFRNPQKFEGHDTAFMYRNEYTEETFNEIKDTLYTKFLEEKAKAGRNFDVNALVGDETNKGSLADGMVIRLYVNGATGKHLSTENSIALFNAEKAFMDNKTQENANAFKELARSFGAKASFPANRTIRDTYYDIYNTWYTTYEPVTGNIIKYGWRDILSYKLQDNGLKLVGKDESKSYELQDENLPEEEADFIENELAVIDGQIEKIYGKSNLEDSPAKRLTGKVKELLSSIKSGSENSLGVKTYLDREVVYRELLDIFAGKSSFNSMYTALKNAAIFKPETLNPIVEFFDSLKAEGRVQDMAMMYNAFALATTEFVLMKNRQLGTKLYVDMINPNRKGKSESVVDKWRKQVVATGVGTTRGVYEQVPTVIEEGQDPVLILTAKKDKVESIKKALDNIKIPRVPNPIVPYDKNNIPELVKSVGDAMWEMGLNIGSNSNITDTYDNIYKLVSNGTYYTDPNGKIAFYKGEAVANIITGLLKNLSTGIKDNSNFIVNNTSVALTIADMFGPVLSIVGESHVGADGKARYATNTQSHMVEIVNSIKEKPLQTLQDYINDPFIGAHGVKEYQSILFRYLLESPEYLADFNVQDLDAWKEDDTDDALGYEDISKIDSYLVRINAYLNGGRKDTSKTFISVQADRSKYTALNTPRISKGKLTKSDKKSVVKAQIVQDFLRIAEAKRVVEQALKTKDMSSIIEGAHNDPRTGKFYDENGNHLGRHFDSKFFQFTATDENGAQIVLDKELTKNVEKATAKKYISDLIDDYVTGKLGNKSKQDSELLDRELNIMVEKVITYMDNQAIKLKEILGADTNRIGLANAQGLTVDEVLQSFVYEETIMRNEMVKLFRGSRVYSKDLTDFYKRMGHLTTPGGKYALKSSNLGSPEWMNGEMYGMMDQYNEMTLADLRLNLNQTQIDNATELVKNLKDGMVAAGFSEEDAIIISSQYAPGSFDSTDAQAYISLEMYRGLAQGEGLWGKEEEAAYKAYKTTGEFVYQPGLTPKGFNTGDHVPVYPIKNYYEKLSPIGKSIAPISEKNSYSVLLASYTKNFPQLEDLRQRMEAVGRYQGLKPVHVTNFVTGKKLVKQGIHKVTGVAGEYENTMVKTNDSRGLRKPQSMPEMKDNPTVTANRQVKKNSIANVADGTDYIYNHGISGKEFKVKGDKLKSLYHSAIEEKLRRDTLAALEELKITDLEVAIGSKDPKLINKAKLDVMKNVRDIIYQQIIDGDLHSNYFNALNIEFDETGAPRFTSPLDLPIYNKKFEPIIMSLLNNRVFKQKVSGYEAVQVAQLGGHAINKDLKFLTIEGKGDNQRLVHAEIMVREDLARKFGVEPGQSLDEVPEELRRILGYRIPNADKSASIILKIKSFLPNNYPKAIVVPGQLIKLMGSDFDVDKLFLMFPHLKQDPNSKYGVSKINPNYKALTENKQSIEQVSYKELDNIILDTMEAVLSNKAHFKETLSPLDDVTLNDEVKRIREAIPEFGLEQNWNDVTTETDALIRNQIGNKLRGIYANIISGRNVVQHGVVKISKDYSIKIEDAAGQVTEYIDYLKVASNGMTTDRSGALFLSAAVDSGKAPIQYELNDSLVTANVRALFLGFHPDYNSRTATNFLNQKYVRMMTDLINDNYSGDMSKIQAAFATIKKQIRMEMAKSNVTLPETSAGVFDGEVAYPMKMSSLENLSRENVDLAEQLLFVNNFVAFNRAGKKLLDLYKRVTPDAMEGMNKLSNMQSYKDKGEAFNTEINEETGEIDNSTIFMGPNNNESVIDQFIGPNSIYGYQRGYENLINNGLSVASKLFENRTSPAFLSFKQRIKEAAGKNVFTSAMHELTDSNIMFMMMLKKDSPFNFFLSENYSRGLYSNPTNNIASRMATMKTQFPKLAATKFISNFQEDIDIANNYYGVKFDGSFRFSRTEKQEFTNTLKAMMNSPQLFLNTTANNIIIVNGVIQDPKLAAQAKQIKNLGIQLSMHTFLTNAFRQGASSYADIIPSDFFTAKQDVGGGKSMSILEYIHNQKAFLQDANYFTVPDLITYMQLFGPMKADGRPIIARKSNYNLTNKTKTLTSSAPNKVVFFRNPTNGETGTFVNVGKHGNDKNLFVRLEAGFKNKNVYSLPEGKTSSEDIGRIQSVVDSLAEFYDKDVKIPTYENNSVIVCGA